LYYKNEFKPDTPNFREERSSKSSQWKPCADNNKAAVALERSRELSNGYIMVSANGGLNQQRVAVSIYQSNHYIFDSSRKYI